MAEKHRLLSGSTDLYSSNGTSNAIRVEYGSVSSCYERVTSASTSSSSSSTDDRPPRFVYRKRDFVIISVLSVLVAASIALTLVIGVPKIAQKSAGSKPTPRPVIEVSAGGFLAPMTAGSGKVATNMGESPASTLLSSTGVHPNAAVSSNCPQCSGIAVNTLQRNGSAVDAAIAATFCLSVCDIHHTGLSGGFLMTVYKRAKREAEVIDARETAPGSSNETMFPTPQSDSRGGLSMAVPGLVAGLWQAHQRHGQLDWPSLIEQSIDLAENGFSVGESLAKALKKKRKSILEEVTLRSILVDPSTGDVYQKGDTLKQPILAQTLKTLSDQGGDSFYTGSLAKNLVTDISNLGGIVSLDDLRNYTVRIRRPAIVDTVVSNGRRTRMYSSPAPGSGHLLGFYLNLMNGFNLTASDANDTVVGLQRRTEALKYLFALRTGMADPDFTNLTQLVDDLTSKKYAEDVRRLIRDDATYPPEHYLGIASVGPSDAGTSHVSIVASNGDAVSVTSTINEKFGALVASESTGIILNNEMYDFALPNVTDGFEVVPPNANFIEPGKRPLSSMCPTLFTDTDGDVMFVTGAAGGTMITAATGQVILRHLWMDQDLEAATDALRIHHQLIPNVLDLETNFSQDLIQGLRNIGHEIDVGVFTTIVNSISRLCKGGLLTAVGDKRADASEAGY